MRTIWTFAILAALLLAVRSAHADEVGDLGIPVGLQVNMPSADIYLQYHGRLFVKSDGGLDEYRWGGTSCGSRTLTEDHVAALHRAVDNKQMRIRPLYQTGQGQTICLVSFTLVPKKNLKLGIP